MIGPLFLVNLKEKIAASVADNKTKQRLWRQYLQCLENQLTRLNICYDVKAALVTDLYQAMPTFQEGEEYYQAVLARYRCCISLNAMLKDKNTSLEQAFQQAAQGTLQDIYQTLTTYWEALCQQNPEQQLEYLALLLGVDDDTTLSHCLSRCLSQSDNAVLKSKLLGLLFKAVKSSPSSHLHKKPLEALLIGKDNIYTPYTANFDVIWDSTQPWLCQQRLATRQQVLGKALLAKWLFLGRKYTYEEEQVAQMQAVLARIFSETVVKPAILLPAALSEMRAIFYRTNMTRWQFDQFVSLPLLAYLLPLVVKGKALFESPYFVGKIDKLQAEIACFLANLSQLMPSDKDSVTQTITVLFDSLVKQLKIKRKVSLMGPLIEKFILKLTAPSLPGDDACYINAAKVWQKQHMSPPSHDTGPHTSTLIEQDDTNKDEKEDSTAPTEQQLP